MMGSDTADANMCTVTHYSTHIVDPSGLIGSAVDADTSSNTALLPIPSAFTGAALNNNNGGGVWDILNTSGTATDWLIGGTAIASKLTVGISGSSGNA